MQPTVIKTFDNYFTANISYTKLQAEGIVCFLKDEFSTTINPAYINLTGGIKLMVDVNDVEIASDLLMKYEEEYLQNINCPSCNQKQIGSIITISKQNKIEAFFNKIFKLQNVNTEKWYVCQICNWKDKNIPQ